MHVHFSSLPPVSKVSEASAKRLPQMPGPQFGTLDIFDYTRFVDTGAIPNKALAVKFKLTCDGIPQVRIFKDSDAEDSLPIDPFTFEQASAGPPSRADETHRLLKAEVPRGQRRPELPYLTEAEIRDVVLEAFDRVFPSQDAIDPLRVLPKHDGETFDWMLPSIDTEHTRKGALGNHEFFPLMGFEHHMIAYLSPCFTRKQVMYRLIGSDEDPGVRARKPAQVNGVPEVSGTNGHVRVMPSVTLEAKADPAPASSN